MDEFPAVPAGDRSQPALTASSEPGGCMSAGLLIFMTAWILIATGVGQSITWVLEQQIFEGTYKILDLRWLVGLGYGVAVLVPAVIIWATGKSLSQRRFYQAFFLAAEFAIFMVPARLVGITHSQETALLQIAGAILFIVVFIFITRRTRQLANWNGIWVTFLIGGALSFPWVLWGALGSAWDTALNLAAALLTGAAAGWIAERIFQREPGVPAPARDILLEGLVMAMVLAVMMTGLGVNGSQGLLFLAVPGLGWALAALYARRARPDGRVAGNRPVLALLVGLAAFWPMAFIDPDELATVISFGPGELIQWANLAAVVGLSIALAAGLVLLFSRAGLPRMRPALGLLAAGVVWAGVAVLYFGLGQPGLYGERLFVILKDQTDVSGAAQIKDYQQRRATVYRTLVEKADTSQADIRKTLDTLRIPYQPYYLENALEVQAGPLVRWWLFSRPEVDRVLESPILRPLPEPLPQARGGSNAPTSTPWNLQMIGADRVWSELGVTGKGVIVGQSDSGVDGGHPEIADSYRGRGGKDEYSWFDPWYHTSAPTDIGGHGTHTLATVLGDHVGVAPDAQWIGCVNLARNLGNPGFYLDCMQFMLAPFPQNGDPLHDGRPELGAQVLNNSWGCPPMEGCDPNAMLTAVSALRAAGIFVVASAGNDGQGGCETIKDPIALYDQVFTVGAIDESGVLAPFSSLGPVEVDGSGRVKPDIIAPGVEVLSAFPGGTYESASGTSMAGPHVVGVVALMWSANPALVGDIGRTQQILDQTASPYQRALPTCVRPGKPNDGVGYGVVNAYEAVKSAMGK
jgi:subtilisin family serine protease